MKLRVLDLFSGIGGFSLGLERTGGCVAGWVKLAMTYGLLGLIAAAIAQRYGFRVPYVPAVDHVALAYLCGAYWLYGR